MSSPASANGQSPNTVAPGSALAGLSRRAILLIIGALMLGMLLAALAFLATWLIPQVTLRKWPDVGQPADVEPADGQPGSGQPADPPSRRS